MSDIVDRLRWNGWTVCAEAADEIERLRAESESWKSLAKLTRERCDKAEQALEQMANCPYWNGEKSLSDKPCQSDESAGQGKRSMSDPVSKLRSFHHANFFYDDALEAADEIERLRDLLARADADLEEAWAKIDQPCQSDEVQDRAEEA